MNTLVTGDTLKKELQFHPYNIVPISIVRNPNLTYLDDNVLGSVYTMVLQGHKFFKTNKIMAKEFHTSSSTISRCVRKIVRLKFLSEHFTINNTRYLYFTQKNLKNIFPTRTKHSSNGHNNSQKVSKLTASILTKKYNTVIYDLKLPDKELKTLLKKHSQFTQDEFQIYQNVLKLDGQKSELKRAISKLNQLKANPSFNEHILRKAIKLTYYRARDARYTDTHDLYYTIHKYPSSTTNFLDAVIYNYDHRKWLAKNYKHYLNFYHKFSQSNSTNTQISAPKINQEQINQRTNRGGALNKYNW